MVATTDLSPDQLDKAKKLAEAAKSALLQQKADIDNDKTGYEALLAAGKSADPDASNDKETGKDKPSASGGLKAVWDTFKKGAQEIGKWASDFVKQLENAPLKLQTKKDIAAVCRQYKELLEATSKDLQSYRGDVRRMFNLFDDVLSLLVPDEEDRNDLKKLSEPNQLKRVSEWATENREQLATSLKSLSACLKDNTSKESILAAQSKWTNLSKRIEAILQEVDEDIREFRKKMSIMIGVGFVFAAVLGAVAIFFTGGAAAAAIAPLVGTVGVWAAGALAGLTVAGLAVFGAMLIAEPEIARTLKMTQEGTVSAINDGLQHIASQTDQLDTILHFLYKDFCEVQANDPEKDVTYRFGKMKVDHLIKTLTRTKEQLQKLEEDIIGTEQVVDEELRLYGEKVYRPLLKMYH